MVSGVASFANEPVELVLCTRPNNGSLLASSSPKIFTPGNEAVEKRARGEVHLELGHQTKKDKEINTSHIYNVGQYIS